MRLVKWYALGLGGLLILTTALAYVGSVRHYRTNSVIHRSECRGYTSAQRWR